MSLTDQAGAHQFDWHAPSRPSPVDRNFVDQVVIDHGPRQLLDPFFRDADAAARHAGVRLTFGDFAELVALNKANGDNWGPLIPLFDPANCSLHDDNAFCLIGRNQTGEAVATHAVRLFHWPATSFKEEAESLRLFYSATAQRKYLHEACTITAPSAREVTGRVAYSGAAWVRPDYRGRALALILPRLAKAYAFTRWRPDFIVSWMTEATYKRGLIAHVGYTTVDWAVEMRRSFVGDLRFAFLSMRERGLLDYVGSFSASLAQVDGGIRKRGA
jgi:hypothetical protein